MSGGGRYPRTRLRRTRRNAALRALLRETQLSPAQLIWPLFVREGEGIAEPIEAMPGQQRLSVDRLVAAAREAVALGIRAMCLFPVVPAAAKSADGSEAENPDGLVPRAVRALKEAAPELLVVTDVALDPYTSHGQDGLVDATGTVLNDPTVAALTRQALCHARAGADIVAPSDMMDGRIGAIRDALEAEGFQDTLILAYAAKYASAYYAPFRAAIGSAALGRGDKRSYQMDPGNLDEAVRECRLDLEEGADILLVKPGMPCLDVVQRVKRELSAPLFAYQVSGEYAMHVAAAERGMIDREAALLESLLCLRRAGADAVISYFALEAAALLAS